MKHRNALETCGESPHGLRRKGDLRDQDDGVLPRVDDLADALEVNLGLAGAGDAVEKRYGKAVAQPGAQGVKNLLLILIED